MFVEPLFLRNIYNILSADLRQGIDQLPLDSFSFMKILDEPLVLKVAEFISCF